jgi:hypothetical protein
MTRRDAAYLLALNALVSIALLAARRALGILRSQKTAFAVLDVAELYRVKESAGRSGTGRSQRDREPSAPQLIDARR